MRDVKRASTVAVPAGFWAAARDDSFWRRSFISGCDANSPCFSVASVLRSASVVARATGLGNGTGICNWGGWDSDALASATQLSDMYYAQWFKFTAADFDMLRQYRSRMNVVERPTRSGGGTGFQITGHHELMIPLLAWAVADRLPLRS